MTWKFIGHEKRQNPIPGIPLECSDEAFEAAVERYESRFGPEGKGSVKKSGLYRQTKSTTAKASDTDAEGEEE